LILTRATRTDNPDSPRVTNTSDGGVALVVPLSSGATGVDLLTLAAAMEGARHYRTASALYALAGEHTTDEAVFRGVRRCERLLCAEAVAE
jgi:hypothetical protein